MVRQRRTAAPDGTDDFADGSITLAQQVNHPSPCGIGDGSKRALSGMWSTHELGFVQNLKDVSRAGRC